MLGCWEIVREHKTWYSHPFGRKHNQMNLAHKEGGLRIGVEMGWSYYILLLWFKLEFEA